MQKKDNRGAELGTNNIPKFDQQYYLKLFQTPKNSLNITSYFYYKYEKVQVFRALGNFF